MKTRMAVPIAAVIPEGAENGAKLAADQLSRSIEHWAASGWSFCHLETLVTHVQPGCVGRLFGARPWTVEVQVAIIETDESTRTA